MISYYLLNLDVCPLQNCRFWDICNSSEKKESETFFSVKLLPSPFFLNVQLLLLLSLSLSLSLSFLLELKLIKPQTNKQTNKYSNLSPKAPARQLLVRCWCRRVLLHQNELHHQKNLKYFWFFFVEERVMQDFFLKRAFGSLLNQLWGKMSL